MKRVFIFAVLAFAFAVYQPRSRAADAPKKADPTLEQRVADLEAYVNNSARQADLVTAWEVIRAAFGDHDAPSTLLGVSVLGYPDQLVEIEAVAAITV